jgi:dsDNA-specific endonuclease/ATPase MutS2
MELEVSRMEGEVFELQARARQEFAKAQQLEGEAQMQAMELALNYRQKEKELMAKIQMFYDNLNNKLQLAGIHAQNKREVTALTEMNKHSMKELDVLSRPRTTNGQG